MILVKRGESCFGDSELKRFNSGSPGGNGRLSPHDDSVDKSITSRQENDQALLGVMTIT